MTSLEGDGSVGVMLEGIRPQAREAKDLDLKLTPFHGHYRGNPRCRNQNRCSQSARFELHAFDERVTCQQTKVLAQGSDIGFLPQ